MPQRIKAGLKTNGGPTRHLQGAPDKVASECVWCKCTALVQESNQNKAATSGDRNVVD